MMVPEKKKALPRSQAEWLLLLVELVSGFAPPSQGISHILQDKAQKEKPQSLPSILANPWPSSLRVLPSLPLPALPYPLVFLKAVP